VSDYLDVNRANWDDRVPIHTASRFYDLDGWVAAPKALQPWEAEYVGDLTGLDVVHPQCHIGTDTLALLNSGAARVTGVDLSAPAIAAATDLAQRAGLADRATFIESDVYAALDAVGSQRFDLVYVSLGALCWLPSVERWAAVVSALLKPGGHLYLHDVHPVAWALSQEDGERFQLAHTYFEETDPYVDTVDVTYTDGEARLAHPKAYEWNHSIGEVVTAVLNNGLRLDRLVEHDWTVAPMMPDLVPDNQGRFHRAPGSPRIPLTFTLTATKS